ncbi:tetratricopeptide repeat protein [Kitasatospora phosalacinea]|uniref:Tetratricopeptide repeat protein n=1 Tax=Kitasatospora phosalacinea TaxID=2065 RepID=A0ABW6GJA0_9ACTN
MGLFARRKTDRAAELLRQALRAEQDERYAEAEQLARQAAETYARAAGPGAVPTADALATLGRALHEQGRAEQAERELRAALDTPALQPDGEVLLRSGLAKLLRNEGRYREAVEEIGRALAVGASLAPSLIARKTNATVLADLGRHREAAEQYAALGGAARREGWEFALVVESNRLAQLAYLGEHEAVERGAARLKAEAAGAADPGATLTRTSADNSLAVSLSLRGRHADAEDLLRRALATGPAGGSFETILRVNLSRALLGQGRTEESRTELDTARAVAERLPALPDADRSALDLAAARQHLAEGDPAAAERAARAGLALCPPSDRPTHRALELRTALGTAEARQGRGEQTLAAAIADWEAHFGTAHHGATAARTALTAPAG